MFAFPFTPKYSPPVVGHMSAETRANGVYFDCGYGKPIGVNITCTGSSCPGLLSYPDLVCTSDSLTTNCNNQIMSCPDNLLPNFQSTFSILQRADGSVNVDLSNTVDGNHYSGTDADGHVSYSTLAAGPSSPSTSTVNQFVLPTSPTSSGVHTRSSASRVSIKRRFNVSLFFGLIILMNTIFARIQAYSFGGTNTGSLTRSAILYPIILSLLSIGVQSQCPVSLTYLNVNSFCAS